MSSCRYVERRDMNEREKNEMIKLGFMMKNVPTFATAHTTHEPRERKRKIESNLPAHALMESPSSWRTSCTWLHSFLTEIRNVSSPAGETSDKRKRRSFRACREFSASARRLSWCNGLFSMEESIHRLRGVQKRKAHRTSTRSDRLSIFLIHAINLLVSVECFFL